MGFGKDIAPGISAILISISEIGNSVRGQFMLNNTQHISRGTWPKMVSTARAPVNKSSILGLHPTLKKQVLTRRL